MNNIEIAKQVDRLVMIPTNIEKWRDKIQEAFNLLEKAEKPDLFSFLIKNDPLKNISVLYLLLALCHDDILKMNFIITDELKRLNPALCSYPQCATYAMQRISIRMDIYLNHVIQNLKEGQKVVSNAPRLVKQEIQNQQVEGAKTEKWYQNRTIQAALIPAVVTVLVAIIAIIFKDAGSIKIKGNQNLGQQPIISNKGDVSMSFVQNQGIDPNKIVDKFADSQKTLGKTESELEKTKSEKQELQNIVNAYKREDKETRETLERAENIEKTKVIVRILQEHDKGNITKEKALKLSEMVNKTSWENLKSFIENKNVQIDEHNQSLVVSGIFKAEIHNPDSWSIRFRSRYSFGSAKIAYILTPEGNKLHEIAKAANLE